LAYAGAFDSLGEVHRAQYFQATDGDLTFLEKVIKYAARYQENKNSSQVSLFGEASEVQIPEPEVPPCEPWHTMRTLKAEKEVVGLFLSGHPLDDFKLEINSFCRSNLKEVAEIENHLNKELSLAGVVTDVNHRVSKTGKGFATFVLEDYNESHEFWIFGEEYLKFRHFLIQDNFVHVKLRATQFTNRDTGEPGRTRIGFVSFKQLQDVLKENAKKLTIQMNVDDLNESQVLALGDLFKTYSGDQLLNFVVYEMKGKIKIHMPSKTQKVKICNELIDELSEQKIKFIIN